MIGRALLALAALCALSGCQLSPIYAGGGSGPVAAALRNVDVAPIAHRSGWLVRSEEHTSELQSLMRSSYAAFCVKHQHTISTSPSARQRTRLNSNHYYASPLPSSTLHII